MCTRIHGSATRALDSLSRLPVDVSNVVVRTIDMHFDHKTCDPKSVSGIAQSLKHKVSRMDQETANVNHLKMLEMVTLPDEGLTTSQKLECVSRWGHVSRCVNCLSTCTVAIIHVHTPSHIVVTTYGHSPCSMAIVRCIACHGHQSDWARNPAS